jgi:hypothetical protein
MNIKSDGKPNQTKPTELLSLLSVPREECRPLTPEQSEIFIRCTLMPDAPLSCMDASRMGEVGNILWGRLVTDGPVEISLGLACFVLLGLAAGNPGQIVMWAFALNRLHWRLRRRITMSDLADAFPIGFPSNEACNKMWNAQKGHLVGLRIDNRLNLDATWAEPAAEINVETKPEKSYDEHLSWCKQRALAYLPHDCGSALSSMLSDMKAHPGTENHVGLGLGIDLAMNGHLSTASEMRRFIEGFN